MENPNFYLEGVVHDKDELKDFEGPLSLILMLLQKNRIEIRDISISDILEQYLDYLAKMQEMDLEVASEFVQMASYLMYIKTKALLSADDEEISELEALMESLEQLKAKDTLAAVKEISPFLLDAYQKGALFVSKPAEPLPSSAMEYQYRHEPEDLLAALLRVFSSGESSPPDIREILTAMPSRIVYSVRNKSRQILERLSIRNLTLKELYADCCSRSEIVATFISVLQLVSNGNIFVAYSRDGNDYEISSAGENIDDILDTIEE